MLHHHSVWASWALPPSIWAYGSNIMSKQSTVNLLHNSSWASRPHGSNKMSLQSIIPHKLASSLFTSLIVFHELRVHMALIKWVRNPPWACFAVLFLWFEWTPCRRAHGFNHMTLQSIVNLLNNSSWACTHMALRWVYYKNKSWACFIIVDELIDIRLYICTWI